MKPPRLCACGAIVPHGQPCACQRDATRARNRRHDQNRPSSRQRGYNRAWQKVRLEFLACHPWCAMCGAPATVVDHIVPHRGDDALFWSPANWQPLCKSCHDGRKQRLERQPHARG